MTFPVVLHLVLVGLIGIRCGIITVTEVSVKAGGSITIPCLYEEIHRNNFKYLCKGESWLSCDKVIKTKQKKEKIGRFSISDNQKENVFTVTINDLTYNDKHFWCAVSRPSWLDVKETFKLSVTSGTPSLFVKQQETEAFERGSVTVICSYSDKRVTKWCRLGGTCEWGGTETNVPGNFSVTLSDLRTENSGWYWCAGEDLQMPVHITVHKLNSVTTTLSPYTTTVTDFTGATESHTDHTKTSMNSTAAVSLKDEPRSSTKIVILVMIVLVQLMIVLAVLLGWKMIKHKKAKPEVCDISMSSQIPDNDVSYSTIDYNHHVSAQTEDQIVTETVMYSTIRTDVNAEQVTATPEGSGTYSMLDPAHMKGF